MNDKRRTGIKPVLLKGEKMERENEKALPCPFCGTEAVIVQLKHPIKVEGKDMKPYCIGCNDPDCILFLDEDAERASLMFTEATTRKYIIRKWNRRLEKNK